MDLPPQGAALLLGASACPRAGWAVPWHSAGEESSRKDGCLGFSGVAGMLLEHRLCVTGNVLWCVRLCHRQRFQSVLGDFIRLPCGHPVGSPELCWPAAPLYHVLLWLEFCRVWLVHRGFLLEGVKRTGLGETRPSKAGIALVS